MMIVGFIPDFYVNLGHEFDGHDDSCLKQEKVKSRRETIRREVFSDSGDSWKEEVLIAINLQIQFDLDSFLKKEKEKVSIGSLLSFFFFFFFKIGLGITIPIKQGHQ